MEDESKIIKISLNTHHALMQIKIDNNFSRIEDAILFLLERFKLQQEENGIRN